MTHYENDQAAYDAGTDTGLAGLSWSKAIQSKTYPVTWRQRNAYRHGFEYGEQYLRDHKKTSHV